MQNEMNGGFQLEIEFDGRNIHLNKVLTAYDRLAIKFSRVLQKEGVGHVYVSGYVALLFGRSRTSEDIDLLVKKMPYDDFFRLWKAISKKFYCHSTEDAGIAYRDYLEDKLALRFSEKDTVIPNVEFKWASSAQQVRVLSDRLTVHLPGGTVPISEIEPQVAYKLYLGSDKDIEDARYLFELFRERMDMGKLKSELADVGVPVPRARRDLGW